MAAVSQLDRDKIERETVIRVFRKLEAKLKDDRVITRDELRTVREEFEASR